MRLYSRIGIILYLIFDYFTALAAWTILFIYRKVNIEGKSSLSGVDLTDGNLLLGIILIPAGWVLFYYVTGTYTDIYKKSRVSELLRTLLLSLIGVTIIFFLLLLDDVVLNYKDYYQTFTVLFLSHFLLTVTSRLTILTLAKKRIESGRI